MTLRPLIAIVIKDLKLHVGNRRAMILTLVVPIAIASFFGSIFGGGAGKNKPSGVGVQVVDLDRSAITEEIIASLEKDDSIKVTRVDESAARQAIKQGKVPVAVIFPKDFGDQATHGFFGRGAKPELTILRDPSRGIEAGMVQGILLQHIMETVGRQMFSGVNGRKYVQDARNNLNLLSDVFSEEDRRVLGTMLNGVDEWLARVSTNSMLGSSSSNGFAMPFAIKSEEAKQQAVAKTGGYNGYAHSFGGMSLQFVLMAAIDWGLSVLLDRQRGLWRRFRAAPLSRETLLGARAVSSAIIAFFTLMVCWGFSIVVFHVQVAGSWAGFLACNAAVAVFAASLGLCLAALGRTPEATRGIAILVILMLVMLGGAWVPTFIFPEWLQKITVYIPTRWAVDGFDAMTWRGLGINAAVGPVAVLLGYAVALGLLARRCFRWEAE